LPAIISTVQLGNNDVLVSGATDSGVAAEVGEVVKSYMPTGFTSFFPATPTRPKMSAPLDQTRVVFRPAHARLDTSCMTRCNVRLSTSADKDTINPRPTPQKKFWRMTFRLVGSRNMPDIAPVSRDWQVPDQ